MSGVVSLRERLRRLQDAQGLSVAERIRRLQDDAAALPVLDGRPAGEILGYDEDGLPR